MDLIGRKLANQWEKLEKRWRAIQARKHGVLLGNDAVLGGGLHFCLGSRDGRSGEIVIGNQASIEHGVTLHAFGGKIDVADNVFIGPYAVIYGHGGVSIGEETLIAMHCCILSSNHTIAERDQIIRRQPDILLPTRIGRDVWLGANVKVLGGVTIGDGCVVGAGAVVGSDLPANSIAVGVPAKIVRMRA